MINERFAQREIQRNIANIMIVDQREKARLEDPSSRGLVVDLMHIYHREGIITNRMIIARDNKYRADQQPATDVVIKTCFLNAKFPEEDLVKQTETVF